MFYLIAGIVLALVVAFWISYRSKEADDELGKELPEDCCGAHEVCESESLLNNGEEIIYYEDEELDRFKNNNTMNYSVEHIEEFREVLFSLKEQEVAGWLKSLQLRQIIPPEIIREEALMIVTDLRN